MGDCAEDRSIAGERRTDHCREEGVVIAGRVCCLQRPRRRGVQPFGPVTATPSEAFLDVLQVLRSWDELEPSQSDTVRKYRKRS
jgi:hypothetical protein